MTASADPSFLVSLYGGDVNTAAARRWMVRHARPILISTAARFETENALRLACFRRKLSRKELQNALDEMATDVVEGFIVCKDVPSARHWQEARRLSKAHCVTIGCRGFDILHVAGAILLEADTLLTFDQKQAALAEAAGLKAAP